LWCSPLKQLFPFGLMRILKIYSFFLHFLQAFVYSAERGWCFITVASTAANPLTRRTQVPFPKSSPYPPEIRPEPRYFKRMGLCLAAADTMLLLAVILSTVRPRETVAYDPPPPVLRPPVFPSYLLRFSRWPSLNPNWRRPSGPFSLVRQLPSFSVDVLSSKPPPRRKLVVWNPAHFP